MKLCQSAWRVGMLSALFSVVTGVYALDNPSEAKSTAQVYFAGGKDEVDSGNTCSIEIEPGGIEYNFPKNGCKNDDMYWYRVENAPSGTLITLYSEEHCPKKSWWFKIRTYIQPTTTAWRKIADLAPAPEKSIITGGILLDKKEYEAGQQVGGKLSCVYIDL
ncbi:hypothetical protein RPPX_16895 [Pseudomonas putida S12]|uniref:Lipoprotein n=1 Tax=Pseudomonas putida S12 TaxID=1215087 RepID=A0AA34WSF0_PSEPU|nr:hypothetical protein [Pseudomonas putida]AJA14965.1 hypothetical protein RPPX_16895 [Pseudomonas putida S12]USX36738.1 hypothetical protein NH673_26855 [Pseudomonas putida]